MNRIYRINRILEILPGWNGAYIRTPKGSGRAAPGASPGLRAHIAESPEGATQIDCSALSGLCSVAHVVPRACALGFPESPLRGSAACIMRHGAEVCQWTQTRCYSYRGGL